MSYAATQSGLLIPRATAGLHQITTLPREKVAAMVDYTLKVPSGGCNPPPDEAKALKDEASALRYCSEVVGARDFPEELWIEPKRWKEYSDWLDDEEMSAEHGRLKGGGRSTNQSPTHQCTCESLMQGWEAAQRAAVGWVADLALWVSVISIYAKANPGEWGGAGCLQVLQILADIGWLPEPIRGQEKKFKLCLEGTRGTGVPGQQTVRTRSQGFPNQRNAPEYWDDAAMKTRRHLSVTRDDLINPRSREEMVCLALHRRVVNVCRRGHAVPKNRAVWLRASDEMPGLAYPDSYTSNGTAIIRVDSWSALSQEVGGSSCIWSPTTPDDWNRPAGEDTPE